MIRSGMFSIGELGGNLDEGDNFGNSVSNAGDVPSGATSKSGSPNNLTDDERSIDSISVGKE